MENLETRFEMVKLGDLAVIGDPVEHSLSPEMQNAALETWNGVMEGKGLAPAVFHKIRVRDDELGAAMALVRSRGMRGVNVTIPHKVAVLSCLDAVHPSAARTGAVNTVKVDGERLIGYNTDGDGFRQALERDLDLDIGGLRVLVLGAGGTGRVAVHQLMGLGADVSWWNRSAERLRAAMAAAGLADGDVHLLWDNDAALAAAREVALIVNTTSVGLAEGDGLPLLGLGFAPGQCAFDVVYHRETPFLAAARAAGARAAGGLGMLVYQGAKSFKIWMNAVAPVDVMRLAAETALQKRGTQP